MEPGKHFNHGETQSVDDASKGLAEYGEFPADTIILGFTGFLGSGCTFISKELAAIAHYMHCELSDEIRAQAPEGASLVDLQELGDAIRAEYRDAGILAKLALKKWNGPRSGFKGLILSGIRNVGEVQCLRQFPNFFVFSIHAERETRYKRLRYDKKVTSREEFDAIDERDSDEKLSYGQQVKKCNYEADIIFNNMKNIVATEPTTKNNYVREGLYDRYVRLIEALRDNRQSYENKPSINEAFMTMAYCESARSRCLKRKVGAVIADIYEGTEPEARGFVISCGHNDVPVGQKACVFESTLLCCARDKIKEDVTNSIKHCPYCGTALPAKMKCSNCGAELDTFKTVCPECSQDTDIKCICPNPSCLSNTGRIDVYERFVPGRALSGGKLLDICRSLHAEESAILNLVRSGGRVTGDTVLFTTTFPCKLCANKIAEVGIRKVVYAEPYRMKEATEVLKDSNVTLETFEGVKSSAFFRLYR